MSTTPSSHPPSLDRPYHTKRPHKKSRAGCKSCKTRKVKCDEGRPACRNCSLRREVCVYPNTPPPAESLSPPSSPSDAMSMTSSSRGDTPPWARGYGVVDQPHFIPSAVDEVDLKLLWFYTTCTFTSFSTEAGRSPRIDNILKVKIPQHAFESRFLMDSIFAMAANHMQHLKQPVDPKRAVAYRAKAFEGYRHAIEAAKPETFPALLACSLMLAVVASQAFREEDTKQLYIVDWMIVWRGIGMIVDIISTKSLWESGMAPLFFRPPIDLNRSALCIPNNLLFMVSSIKPDDPDFPDVQTYYEALKYLGSLYLEAQNGTGPILNLRVVTWFTFLPMGFVNLAQQKRPRALVILAHYLVFTRLLENVWWMRSIGPRQIREICHHLGAEWFELLQVPRLAVHTNDKLGIIRLLFDDPEWLPPEPVDKFHDDRDPRTKALTFVDDAGRPVTFKDGFFSTVEQGMERPIWNRSFRLSADSSGPGDAGNVA